MGRWEVIHFRCKIISDPWNRLNARKLLPGSFLPGIYQANFVEIYSASLVIPYLTAVLKDCFLLCKQENFPGSRKFSTKW
jgi:hypothetical protein